MVGAAGPGWNRRGGNTNWTTGVRHYAYPVVQRAPSGALTFSDLSPEDALSRMRPQWAGIFTSSAYNCRQFQYSVLDRREYNEIGQSRAPETLRKAGTTGLLTRPLYAVWRFAEFGSYPRGLPAFGSHLSRRSVRQNLWRRSCVARQPSILRCGQPDTRADRGTVHGATATAAIIPVYPRAIYKINDGLINY